MAIDPGMKTQLDLRLTQRLAMTPQLQQAIKLLQLSRLELQQFLTQQLQENPVLEEVAANEIESEPEPGEGPETGEGAGDSVQTTEADPDVERDREDWMAWLDEMSASTGEGPIGEGHEAEASEASRPAEERLTRTLSLGEHLSWQLQMMATSEREREVGNVIIGNIDDDGYLRATLEELARDSRADPPEVERVLRIVQQFDPPGSGARDLRECLLIQIQALGLAGSPVERIVRDHLPDLEKRRYPVIARALGVPVEKVMALVTIIQHLEPIPGRAYRGAEALAIVPDLAVVSTPEGYRVILVDEGWPKIRVGAYYRRLRTLHGDMPEETRRYLAERFRAAEWLIKSIAQRNRTILRVAESIVAYQQAFFEKGVAFLKPLVLRQVAEDCRLHESTVSRVTSNKFIQTPRGLLSLKFFFTAGIPRLGGDGQDFSSAAVRQLIAEMVQHEDPRRPLRDQDIVEQLRREHAAIARRTVAKYRAELRIPPAAQRRRSA